MAVHTKDYLHVFGVITEIDELMESDGVDVVWLVQRNEEEEGVLGKRFCLQERVLSENAGALRMSFLQQAFLEEQIDEIAEGEEASSTSQYNDLSRWSNIKL